MKTATARASLLIVSLLILAAPATSRGETDRLIVEDATSNVKFKVTSDGNVTGNSISVQQGAAEAAITPKVAVKNAAGDQVFSVTAEGRLGLGTNTTPTVVLHAKGDSLYKSQAIMHYNATNPNGGGGYIAYHNNGTGLPFAGDRLGYILFGSLDTNGITTRNGAGVVARAEQNWSSTSIPSYFAFETTSTGAATRAERMRITGSGDMGLGTTAPTQKLEINGGVRLNTATAKPACDSTTRGTFWVTQGTPDDLVQVCAMSGSTLAWKTVSLL